MVIEPPCSPTSPHTIGKAEARPLAPAVERRARLKEGIAEPREIACGDACAIVGDGDDDVISFRLKRQLHRAAARREFQLR